MVDFTDMSLDRMQANALKASNLLKSMSNQTRLMVLCHLVSGPRTVTQLQDRVQLSQSALSQHLAVLRRERLVTTKRSSQSIYYSLASKDVEAVLTTLYQLYCATDKN